MLGVVLLYVGIVLINNGIARITNIDSKSAAVMNVFVGLLSIIINIITIVHGDFILIDDVGDFYSAATGLLFGFTYLFVAVNSIFNLDNRLYGWYSLFVAINTIPAAWIDFYKWRLENGYNLDTMGYFMANRFHRKCIKERIKVCTLLSYI